MIDEPDHEAARKSALEWSESTDFRREARNLARAYLAKDADLEATKERLAKYVDDAIEEVEAHRTEVERLKKYADHSDDCERRRRNIPGRSKKCTCGLEDLR